MAQMPQALREALERELAGRDARQMERDAQAISARYRTMTGEGRRLLTARGEALAYAAARMPATYAAAHAALTQALACSCAQMETLLDVGAGTGAASWAASSLLELTRVTCVEREAAMREAGAALMAAGGPALAGAAWVDADVTGGAPLPRAQLVVEGYMLGELAAGARMAAARKIWDAAERMAVFIEPGTPQGFANLACVRRELASLGAHVAAPCPDVAACPMAGADWCHFAVRVQRTRLQKALKGGDAPYEDEKYCYLALTREAASPCGARVLRHPQIAPGRIGLTLCTPQGARRLAVTKKDPLWKRARKISAGDAL